MLRTTYLQTSYVSVILCVCVCVCVCVRARSVMFNSLRPRGL